MNEFALMAIAGILTNNVITGAGLGAISLQSEKRNFLFTVTTMACTSCATIIAGLLYAIIYKFVLAPLNVGTIGLFVMVILAVIFAYISRLIVKFMSREQFYLYEKSYQLSIQTILMLAIMLLISYSESILSVMFQLAMSVSGFIIISLLFYPLYEKLDNKMTLKPARNIPLMLYTLSIFAMIISAIISLI